jgi:hypothetical protein
VDGEAGQGLQVQVTPNPARENAQVFVGDGHAAATLCLRTATGQPVLTRRITFGWNTVPLEGVAPGIYFWEVREKGEILGSGKLVKVE